MEYNYCHGSKLKVVRKKQGHRKTIKNGEREREGQGKVMKWYEALIDLIIIAYDDACPMSLCLFPWICLTVSFITWHFPIYWLVAHINSNLGDVSRGFMTQM